MYQASLRLLFNFEYGVAMSTKYWEKGVYDPGILTRQSGSSNAKIANF